MAVLTPKIITGAGASGTYVAASVSGDSFPANSDERVFLHVKNGGASPITVSILAQTLTEKVPGVGSFNVANLGGSVINAGDAMFGPFPRDYVGANGQVQVTYSAITSVTVAAYSLPRAD